MSFSSRTPASIAANALSSALAAARSDPRFIDLAAANPTSLGLSPSPSSLAAAFSAPENARYVPDPRGVQAAREAIAERCVSLSREDGLRVSVDAGDVFLSASTSEAYSWAFKLLCDPGDAVLVPKPGYPLFELLAGLECIRAESYRLEYSHPAGWSIDTDDVARALSRGAIKAVVAIHPNNPTGSYVKPGERRELVSLCARFGAALIVDEVFRTYPLESPRQAGFSGETDALTLALDGASKCLCLPQLKLGWTFVSGPPREAAEAKARLELIADTYLSASAQSMHAIAPLLALEGGIRDAVGARCRANLAALRQVFGGEASPYRVLRCDAGWTAVLEYPRVVPEDALCGALLERDRVYAHPGYFYDRVGDGALAISLIVEGPRFLDACQRIKDRIDSYL